MTATEMDLLTTDSRKLRAIADDLKQDAKLLHPSNKEEAMRLFKLYRQVVKELHRRSDPAINYQFN